VAEEVEAYGGAAADAAEAEQQEEQQLQHVARGNTPNVGGTIAPMSGVGCGILSL